MKEIKHQLWTYLTLLFKKWVLWLFVVFSLIGLIADIVFPKLSLPLLLYGGLGLIGLLWASFQVYRELVAQMPEHLQALQLKPELALELVEGNEYTYLLLDLESSSRYLMQRVESRAEPESDDSKDKEYALPDALIVLHVRISNTGSIGVDVLSVDATYEEYKKPWNIMLPEPEDVDGQAIVFPVRLDPGGIMLCDLRSNAKPKSYYNDAQFAARLSGVQQESPNPLKTTITVEAMDPAGSIASFELVCEVATRPLKDLYITLWQEENRSDLLRLAHADEHIPASQPWGANTNHEEQGSL